MAFERYTTTQHGLKIRVHKGLVWQPRFYCDDTNFTGLPDYLWPFQRKQPTVHLAVTPLVNWVGDLFDWSIAASNSTTSTIDEFEVWFKSTVTPDLLNQDWQVDPLSGQFTYDTAGFYTVEAQVTDILGEKSQIGSVMVEVIDKTERLYIATEDLGVFYLDATPGSEPVAINTGLTGDHLKVRHLQLHPLYRTLTPDRQHLWIATAAGVAYSLDGGTNWTTIDKAALGVPENEQGDNPAPTTDDLDQVEIEFSMLYPERVFVTRTKASGATPARAWLYFTLNYGSSWSNQQVVT